MSAAPDTPSTTSSRAAPDGVSSQPTPAAASTRATHAVSVPTAVTPTSTSLGVSGSSASLALPSSLVPRFETSGSATAGFVGPLVRRAGVPSRIVQACRTSIVTAAVPYGAVQVDAASVGEASRTPDGGLTAPIAVRVVYARASARQVRQSRVACRLNAAGAVVALR
jgi:hypothetical protein